MSLTIVKSEDNLAIDEYFFRLARRAIESTKQSIAIIPSQASFSTERRILEMCEGIMSLVVMSMEKLAHNIMDKTGGRALAKMDGVSVAMLVKQSMIKNKTQLSFSEGTDPELHVKIASLIMALKAEGISPGELLATKAEGSLGKKVKDIALIYSDISQCSAMDGADVLKFASGKIAESPWLFGSNIMVFGFDVLTKAQADIVRELSLVANVVCGFCTLGEGKNACEKLKKMCGGADERQIKPSSGRNVEVDHIFKNYAENYAEKFESTPNDVAVHRCSDERNEVRTVAARILELHCKYGVNMSDMAVVCAQPKMYSPYIADVFDRCKIPYFLEGKRKLMQSPLGVFISSALGLCVRANKSDLLAHIGTNLTHVNHESNQLIYAVIKTRGLKPGQLLKPLGKRHEDFEPIRSAAFDDIAKFISEMKSSSDKVSVLLEYIKNMQVREKLEAYAQRLETADLQSQARFVLQLADKFEELALNSKQFIKNPDIKTFKQVIEAGMQSVEIAVVPQRTDEVTVGDLTHSIIPRKKAMFIIGVNYGVLPAPLSPDALLGEKETAELKKQYPSFPSKLAMEDQKGYIIRALTCSEKITLTYNEKIPPSHVVARIKSLFPELAELGQRSPQNIRGGLAAVAKELSSLKEGGSTVLLPSYLSDKRTHDLLASLLKHVEAENTAKQLSKSTARELYGTLHSGVSRIENRYSCPYKHFLDYGIRPWEPTEYEENAASAGTYVHSLIDGFSKRVGETDWKNFTDDALKGIVDESAQEIYETHNDGIFTEDARADFTEKRLRKEVYFATRALRDQLKGTEVNFVASEKSFGFNGELTFDTRLGTLKLRGKIDRIDVVKSGDETFVRVVDYKTGAKTFSLSELYYGLNLQLMVYLLAVRNMYRKKKLEVVPSGGYYFGIKLPIIEYGGDEQSRLEEFEMSGFVLKDESLIEKLTPESGTAVSGMSIKMLKDGSVRGNAYTREEIKTLLEFTEKLIANAVEDIYDGDVCINPNPNGKYLPCKYCAYGSVCRFDKEVQKECKVINIDSFKPLNAE